MSAARSTPAKPRATTLSTSTALKTTAERAGSAPRTTTQTARETRPPLYAPAGAQVLVDSGPLLALFNRSDRWHASVADWLRTNPRIGLVTTWCVLTEVCAMLSRRVHVEAALDVLRWSLRGGIKVDGAPQDALVSILAISERFADLPFDLADASIADAAERMRIRRILSIDSDFDVYRDRSGRALQNVLVR
jgi:uncharacterized protein